VLTATWFVLGGMAITFATLVLLMLVMNGLNALLRPRSTSKGHFTKQRHA
jgi:Na+-transporting methylmalonyl-CoA/oxaloacetate decarboxylase gamma subunit